MKNVLDEDNYLMYPPLFTNYYHLNLYYTGPVQLTKAPISSLLSSQTNVTYNFIVESNDPIEDILVTQNHYQCVSAYCTH